MKGPECGRRLSAPIPESRSQSGRYMAEQNVERAGLRPALSQLPTTCTSSPIFNSNLDLVILGFRLMSSKRISK